jgi:hypothetical protein
MKKLIMVIAVGMMTFATQALAGNGDLIVDGKIGVGGAPTDKLTVLSTSTGGATISAGTWNTSIFSGGHALGLLSPAFTGGLALSVGGNGVGVIQAYNPTTENGTLLLNPNGGNVGIGTTNPGATLELNGTAKINGFLKQTIFSGLVNGNGTELYFDGTESVLQSYDRGGTNTFHPMFISGSSVLLNAYGGNIGIGTTGPAYSLDVNGQVRANNVAVTSDERYKKNITTVQNALSTVLRMEGVSYEWKGPEEYLGASATSAQPTSQATADVAGLLADGTALKTKTPEAKNFPAGRHYGVLAQDMEKVLPEIVSTDINGDKAVAYFGIIPVLIEAIKEQQKMIDSLKAEVAQLKSNP